MKLIVFVCMHSKLYYYYLCFTVMSKFYVNKGRKYTRAWPYLPNLGSWEWKCCSINRGYQDWDSWISRFDLARASGNGSLFIINITSCWTEHVKFILLSYPILSWLEWIHTNVWHLKYNTETDTLNSFPCWWFKSGEYLIIARYLGQHCVHLLWMINCAVGCARILKIKSVIQDFIYPVESEYLLYIHINYYAGPWD